MPPEFRFFSFHPLFKGGKMVYNENNQVQGKVRLFAGPSAAPARRRVLPGRKPRRSPNHKTRDRRPLCRRSKAEKEARR